MAPPFRQKLVARTGPGSRPRVAAKQLKEAVLEAATRIGQDGRGRDGLVGYLMMLATDQPKSFTVLLSKVLPMQVTGADGGPLRVVDERMTPAEAAEAYAETLRSVPGLAEPSEELELGPDEYREVDPDDEGTEEPS